MKWSEAIKWFEEHMPPNDDTKQSQAVRAAIKALFQPPNSDWSTFSELLYERARRRGRRETCRKIKDIVDAEAWAYCDYLLRKYKGGSPEAEGASALASNIRERIDDELEKEDKT